MIFENFDIVGPILCKPRLIKDARGYFTEIFRKDLLEDFSEENFDFCQINSSVSNYGILRGLHFQTYPYSQTKLVSVSKGKILDIIVDLRKNSKTFGKTLTIELNDENNHLLLVPKGFAHGFLVLSPLARVDYRVDNYYSPKNDLGINSLDSNLSLNLDQYVDKIKRSKKDKNFPNLCDCPYYKF